MELSTRQTTRMFKNNTSKVLAVLAGLALVSVTANAQLLLLSASGSFASMGDANISNGPAISTYQTPGLIPAVRISAETQSTPVMVNANDFTNVSTWTIQKLSDDLSGIDTNFNYTLDFDFAGGGLIDLSLQFDVAASAGVVAGNNVYFYSITPGVFEGTINIDGQDYRYGVIQNGESGRVGVGGSSGIVNFDVAVNFVPVPEPSTYALFGVGALGAIVGYRRLRAKKAQAA